MAGAARTRRWSTSSRAGRARIARCCELEGTARSRCSMARPGRSSSSSRSRATTGQQRGRPRSPPSRCQHRLERPYSGSPAPHATDPDPVTSLGMPIAVGGELTWSAPAMDLPRTCRPSRLVTLGAHIGVARPRAVHVQGGAPALDAGPAWSAARVRRIRGAVLGPTIQYWPAQPPWTTPPSLSGSKVMGVGTRQRPDPLA